MSSVNASSISIAPAAITGVSNSTIYRELFRLFKSMIGIDVDEYDNNIIADKWKQLDNLIENNDPCSICHDRFTEAECKDQNNIDKHMVTPSVCNHRYHRQCLLGVMECKQSSQPLLCPLCRAPFHEITTVRV